MRTTIARVVIGAAAFLLAGVAVAQGVPQIEVQAKRVMSTKTVEHIAGGVPVIDVSVSYTVSARDIDISTSSGAKVLEQRVKDAAATACKEISRQFPDATPNEAECANTAAAKAMTQVHLMVATAEKNRTK